VSLRNGISFRPMDLAGCNKCDRHTDGPRSDTSVVIGRIADATLPKTVNGFSTLIFQFRGSKKNTKLPASLLNMKTMKTLYCNNKISEFAIHGDSTSVKNSYY